MASDELSVQSPESQTRAICQPGPSRQAARSHSTSSSTLVRKKSTWRASIRFALFIQVLCTLPLLLPAACSTPRLHEGKKRSARARKRHTAHGCELGGPSAFLGDGHRDGTCGSQSSSTHQHLALPRSPSLRNTYSSLEVARCLPKSIPRALRKTISCAGERRSLGS